jgi:hypothetical protein
LGELVFGFVVEEDWEGGLASDGWLFSFLDGFGVCSQSPFFLFGNCLVDLDGYNS